MKVAEGKIELDQEYNSKSAFTSYYVYVGRKKFGFTESMNHIFTEGVKYRVYYVKASAYDVDRISPTTARFMNPIPVIQAARVEPYWNRQT